MSRGRFAALKDVTYLVSDFVALLDPMFLEHGQKVAHLAEVTARNLGWDANRAHRVYVGGLFHDIGHLVITARGRDQDPEHAAPRGSHPELGAKVLSRVGSLKPIIPIVRHHHEHYDGSGGPDGLKGDQIPEDARLISVADAFQRLREGRGGISAMPLEEALQVIREDAGIIHDPAMVDAFLKVIEQDMETYREWSHPEPHIEV